VHKDITEDENVEAIISASVLDTTHALGCLIQKRSPRSSSGNNQVRRVDGEASSANGDAQGRSSGITLHIVRPLDYLCGRLELGVESVGDRGGDDGECCARVQDRLSRGALDVVRAGEGVCGVDEVEEIGS